MKFKNRGNLKAAYQQLKNDQNNAISFIYPHLKESIKKEKLLSNVIVTIKDLYATKDAPTQASSKILTNFWPGYDATIVKKLKTSEALIIAKTHMDELALGGTGEFSGWGVINNPLDPTRMPGGSSSGAVASFSQNIGLALGSDTGNSVRLPASFCGLVGFKPSYGAVSRYGMFAFASSLDTVGWFTHNVNDAIVASQVLFGVCEYDLTSKNVVKPVDQLIKPQKVAFLESYDQLSPTVLKAYLDLKQKLINDGVKVDLVKIEEKIFKLIDPIYEIISYSEVSSNDANLSGIHFGKQVSGDNWEDTILKTRSKYLGKMVQRRFTLGAFYLSKENQKEIFQKAQKARRLIYDTYNQIFDQYDLIAFPTSTIAPKWKEGKKDSWHSEYCTVSNLVGNPSISIPFTTDQKMPVGLLLDSKIYRDKELLSYALYFEKVIGDHDRK